MSRRVEGTMDPRIAYAVAPRPHGTGTRRSSPPAASWAGTGLITCRLRSSITNEWLYVFKPTVAAMVLYLKVAIRQDCIVVSLHEDEEEQ